MIFDNSFNFIISVSITPQESHLQNPLKFQVGIYNYNGLFSYWGPIINLNYNFSKHVELGVDVAYNYYTEEHSNDFTNHIQRLFYGVNGYYHFTIVL